MRTTRLPELTRAVTILAAVLCFTQPAQAQDEEGTAAAPKIWANQADIGVVITGGNSRNQTISFDNQLRGEWIDRRFTLRLGAYRQTSDDITHLAYLDGTGEPVPGELSIAELDQLRLYINGAYRRNFSDAFFWTTGLGWDRDVDAGINSRFIGFVGVGNTWIARDRTAFSTEYTFAYEYRDDEIEDPDLGKARPSVRLAWDYMNMLFDSKTNTLTNTMDFFFNLKEASAYRFVNMTALTVGLSELLSLRTSLEFRYDNVPGLEEVDLWSADPNLDPNASIIGSTNIRKQKLDTIFKLTVVFNL